MKIRELPPEARHTFYYDLRSGMLFGVFGGLLLPFVHIVGRKIGASNFQIALLAAVPFAANAFSLLWTEDLFGKGRVWYVVWPGVAGRAVLLAMFFVSTPGPYVWVVFLYMLITAIPFPSYASIMKTNYPESMRGRLMSYVRVGIAVFWIASSALGGLFLDRETSNFRYLFPIASVFGVLSALQFGAIKVRREKRGREGMKGFAHLAEPLKDPAFRRFILSYSLFEVSILLVLPVYPLVLVDEIRISNLAAGIYGAVYSGMWLAGFFFWGRLIDRHTVGRTLLAMILIACGSPLLYLFSRDIFVLGAAQGVSGFTFAAMELVGYVVVTRMSTNETVARYMAANVAIGGVRGAVAPFAGAWLMKAAGAGAVFSLALFLGLISAAHAWRTCRG